MKGRGLRARNASSRRDVQRVGFGRGSSRDDAASRVRRLGGTEELDSRNERRPLEGTFFIERTYLSMKSLPAEDPGRFGPQITPLRTTQEHPPKTTSKNIPVRRSDI